MRLFFFLAENFSSSSREIQHRREREIVWERTLLSENMQQDQAPVSGSGENPSSWRSRNEGKTEKAAVLVREKLANASALSLRDMGMLEASSTREKSMGKLLSRCCLLSVVVFIVSSSEQRIRKMKTALTHFYHSLLWWQRNWVEAVSFFPLKKEI